MSKLLIHENPLTFQPSLASAIGLNEAIVLQQVHYWINNPKNKGYEQDGYKWIYNTYAEWKEANFPFWSENTIQRTFSNLEDAGLIISIQPMKSKYNRTKYYRIDYTKLETFEDTKSTPIEDTKLVCSLDESETTTETTNNGADAPKIEFPLEWQIAKGGEIKQPTQEQDFRAKVRDVSSLIDFQCLGAGALAEAFMSERGILIPETKIKGNRKAAREMLEMGVRAEHVKQATRQLIDKGMTVTDLFSVSKTAIDLANKPLQTERPEYKPLNLEDKKYVPRPDSVKRPNIGKIAG
jgi:hypothetical protein